MGRVMESKGHALPCPARVIGILSRFLMAYPLQKGNRRLKQRMLEHFEDFQQPLFERDKDGELDRDPDGNVQPISETGPGCDAYDWVDGSPEFTPDEAEILEKGLERLTGKEAIEDPPPHMNHLRAFPTVPSVTKAVNAAASAVAYWKDPDERKPNLRAATGLPPKKRTKLPKASKNGAAKKRPAKKAAKRARKKAAKKKAKRK